VLADLLRVVRHRAQALLAQQPPHWRKDFAIKL
jgi:hypothetical protein